MYVCAGRNNRHPCDTLGTIVSSEEGLLVATGSGSLLLLEVSPEGKRRMSAAAFARG